MGLSSLQLEAFVEVAKNKSFSRAAEVLHITQSALSQRIINLEREIETSLLIRDPAGLRLTSAGEELLRYCRAKAELEVETLGRLAQKVGASGTVRVAGFSSIMRSMVLPVIAHFANMNPGIRVELFNRELRDLLPLLMRNEVDFILTTHKSHRLEIESHELGTEDYVLVQPKSGKLERKVYLDHDTEDTITQEYLKLQKGKFPKIERDFLDEVYAIIDGVALGLGQAVLPKHLVVHDRRLKVVAGQVPLRIPFYLQYYRQPYYSQLHMDVVRVLREKIPSAMR
jgi:DNA-binding transcriptional LysR family regulator